MSPIECAYPDRVVIDSDGRCMSADCPSRDDCDGVSDAVIEAVLEENPDQLAMLDELEHRVNAVERQLSELKRSLELWIQSMEGADRGPD